MLYTAATCSFCLLSHGSNESECSGVAGQKCWLSAATGTSAMTRLFISSWLWIRSSGNSPWFYVNVLLTLYPDWWWVKVLLFSLKQICSGLAWRGGRKEKKQNTSPPPEQHVSLPDCCRSAGSLLLTDLTPPQLSSLQLLKMGKQRPHWSPSTLSLLCGCFSQSEYQGLLVGLIVLSFASDLV